MLSFDVEEYFHVEAAALLPAQWGEYPSRLAPAMEQILQLLREHQAGATFFVLGWVARRYGPLVRAISQAGHEIASHGDMHAMLHRLGPKRFREDLLASRAVLEDVTGRPVVGYRAPTFSITHETAWAIDVLAENGFVYDSSIFPIRHDRYGVPEAPTVMHHAIGPRGGRVIEIPPLCLSLPGANLPVGGGGYLRLLPVAPVAWALRRCQNHGSSGLLYVHPWELDPGQPELPMGRMSRWRHRVNLHTTAGKLRRLMGAFRFGSIRQAMLDRPPQQSFFYSQQASDS